MSANGSQKILCETADYLANNTLLRATIVIRLVLAILGLALFALLFKIQGTYLSFHSNARILLVAHHVWSILQSLTTFGNYLFAVIRFWQNYDDSCLYLMTMALSVSVRGPSLIFTYGQLWALAAMAVERSWATARYKTYESKKSTLGKMLIMLQCLLTLLWFWLAIAWLDWSELKAYPTVSSGKTSAIFSNTLSALGAVELVALFVFYGLSLINTRIRNRMKDANLTIKYQLDENIRAIQLMIPMVVTHFCCFMPTLIVLPMYMKINPGLDPKDYTVFLELFNFSPFYSDILPVVLFWRHRMLRQNLRKAIGIEKKDVVQPTRADGRTHDQVRHFEVLKQMWVLPKS